VQSLLQEQGNKKFTVDSLAGEIRQYGESEIEELLFLRRSLRKETESAKALRQNEIDDLFG
jgi:hypothetical protein